MPSCHSGEVFDDGKLHDVGTGDQSRDREGAESRFNTPSLRGIARTAPYLHDGRAVTLEDIFTKHNTQKKHGDSDQFDAGRAGGFDCVFEEAVAK